VRLDGTKIVLWNESIGVHRAEMRLSESPIRIRFDGCWCDAFFEDERGTRRDVRIRFNTARPHFARVRVSTKVGAPPQYLANRGRFTSITGIE
jgi:hypothetical protein